MYPLEPNFDKSRSSRKDWKLKSLNAIF